jgi:hypothetical protein
MDKHLRRLLGELEQLGSANDGAVNDRLRKMLNITCGTGEFLAVLVRATGARRIQSFARRQRRVHGGQDQHVTVGKVKLLRQRRSS